MYVVSFVDVFPCCCLSLLSLSLLSKDENKTLPPPFDFLTSTHIMFLIFHSPPRQIVRSTIRTQKQHHGTGDGETDVASEGRTWASLGTKTLACPNVWAV